MGKIEVVLMSEDLEYERDYRSGIRIKFNDTDAFEVVDGEAEDNSLSRNFHDCYKIGTMLQQVYDLGRSGEELEYLVTVADNEDDFYYK